MSSKQERIDIQRTNKKMKPILFEDKEAVEESSESNPFRSDDDLNENSVSGFQEGSIIDAKPKRKTKITKD